MRLDQTLLQLNWRVSVPPHLPLVCATLAVRQVRIGQRSVRSCLLCLFLVLQNRGRCGAGCQALNRCRMLPARQYRVYWNTWMVPQDIPVQHNPLDVWELRDIQTWWTWRTKT